MGTQIKTYICKTKCFFRNRVWYPGETLEVSEGEQAPVHFVAKAEYKPDLRKQPPSDPKTFAEWQRQEAQAALRSVGHGKPADKPKASVPAAPTNAEGEAQAPIANAEEAFS